MAQTKTSQMTFSNFFQVFHHRLIITQDYMWPIHKLTFFVNYLDN
jgi:hypothetical protein